MATISPRAIEKLTSLSGVTSEEPVRKDFRKPSTRSSSLEPLAAGKLAIGSFTMTAP
jgi:hypothetical protein